MQQIVGPEKLRFCLPHVLSQADLGTRNFAIIVFFSTALSARVSYLVQVEVHVCRAAVKVCD
jgi:hypothetical protein